MFSEEVKIGQNMGFQMFPTSPGPFSTYYDGVLKADLGVLTRSNRPGKHESKQNKSSVHKAASVHANIYMASASGGETFQFIRSDKGLQFMASYPTESEWFTRFMAGLFSRIGERRNLHTEISIELMIEMHRLLELEWHLEVKQNNK